MTLSFATLAVGALFSLQAVLMGIDEWLYHRRRGLEHWERWGHPVDSLLYLCALAIPGWMQPATVRVLLYTILAILSCVAITKDEWVHAERCEAGEHWVHAVLFMIHPSVLIFVGLLWVNNEASFLRASLPVWVGILVCYQIFRRSNRGAAREPDA
jgi:hypothetical protein